jgi:putative DNA methylase
VGTNTRTVWILGHRERLVDVARYFRRAPTGAEAVLWGALRRRRLLNVKFRRQHPVGPFIVDFYAPQQRVVVEVDGPIHDEQRVKDLRRQGYLERKGLSVIRFSADEVESDIEAVAARIAAALNASTSPP